MTRSSEATCEAPAAASARLRAARAALLAAAALLLLSGLGDRDLWAPDEPRLAQVAEELRSFQHGAEGLVVLHLAGEVYTQKPPLYYWLAAAFGALPAHVTEAAARLPSALAGLAAVWLVIYRGAALIGPRAALCAGALLLTSHLFAYTARRAQLDVLLLTFESAALLAFWHFDRGLGARRSALFAMHAATAGALLTKGPVGLVPWLAIAAFLAWDGRAAQLRRVFAPPWLALSLGPLLAWLFLAVALAPAGYFHAAVVDNLFGRFALGTSHARPFWYYARQLPIDLLPWTLLLPAAALHARRALAAGGEQTRAIRFLLAWLGVPLVFFTLSAGKRGLYLLPLFPAAALLGGAAVERWLAAARAPARGVSALSIGAACAILASSIATLATGRSPFVEPIVPPPRAYSLALIAIAAAKLVASAWISKARAGRLARAVVAWALVFAVELASFTLLYPAFEPEKSPRPIALAAAAAVDAADPRGSIGIFARPTLVGAIAYYSGRPVVSLPDANSATRFAQSGGRVVIVLQRSLAALEAAAGPCAVRGRSRSGARELLVVTTLAHDPPAGVPGRS